MKIGPVAAVAARFPPVKAHLIIQGGNMQRNSPKIVTLEIPPIELIQRGLLG